MLFLCINSWRLGSVFVRLAGLLFLHFYTFLYLLGTREFLFLYFLCFFYIFASFYILCFFKIFVLFCFVLLYFCIFVLFVLLYFVDFALKLARLVMRINGWKRRSIIGIMGRRKNNKPRPKAMLDYFFWGPLLLYIDHVYHPLIHNISFFNFIYPIQGENKVLKKSGALSL